MLSNLPQTVLLVDDNQDDLLLFERACLKAGVDFNVRTATDGQHAISYLKGEGTYQDRVAYPKPGLVILHVNMPSVSGFEVLRWLRSASDCPDMVVIMFTTSAAEKDVALAYELKANSYLVKPLQLDDFVSTIALIERYWLKLNLRPGAASHAVRLN